MVMENLKTMGYVIQDKSKGVEKNNNEQKIVVIVAIDLVIYQRALES